VPGTGHGTSRAGNGAHFKTVNMNFLPFPLQLNTHILRGLSRAGHGAHFKTVNMNFLPFPLQLNTHPWKGKVLSAVI